MLLCDFARTKGARDKQKRKKKGRYGIPTRDTLSERIAGSALEGTMARARRGKYSAGMGNTLKLLAAELVAKDKEGVKKRVLAKGKKMAELEHKIAKRQAAQLNKGKQLADPAAAGLLYDRTKGKYFAASLGVQ